MQIIYKEFFWIFCVRILFFPIHNSFQFSAVFAVVVSCLWVCLCVEMLTISICASLLIYSSILVKIIFCYYSNRKKVNVKRKSQIKYIVNDMMTMIIIFFHIFIQWKREWKSIFKSPLDLDGIFSYFIMQNVDTR